MLGHDDIKVPLLPESTEEWLQGCRGQHAADQTGQGQYPEQA